MNSSKSTAQRDRVEELGERPEGPSPNHMGLRCTAELFGVSDIWNTSPVGSMTSIESRNHCSTPTDCDATSDKFGSMTSFASLSSASRNESWRYIIKKVTKESSFNSSQPTSFVDSERALLSRSDTLVSPNITKGMPDVENVDSVQILSPVQPAEASHQKSQQQLSTNHSNIESNDTHHITCVETCSSLKCNPASHATRSSKTNSDDSIYLQATEHNTTILDHGNLGTQKLDNGSKESGSVQNSIQKDALCRHFILGRCNRRRCRFRHSSPGANKLSAKAADVEYKIRNESIPAVPRTNIDPMYAFSNFCVAPGSVPDNQIRVVHQFVNYLPPMNTIPNQYSTPNYAHIHYRQTPYQASQYSLVANESSLTNQLPNLAHNDANTPMRMLIPSQVTIPKNMVVSHHFINAPVHTFMH